MRPYLGTKNAQNLSAWFESDEILSDKGKFANLISPIELISLSKEKDFHQLLLESSIKCEETYVALQTLIKQNNDLKEAIIRNLK